MNNTLSSFLNGILFTVYSFIFLATTLGEFRIGSFSFSDATWKKWLFGLLYLLFIVNTLYAEFKGKK